MRVDELQREGYCQCERANCVGKKGKVYCYFGRDLAPWVVGTGLYKECYDEVMVCPRCDREHKRGHIGSSWACGRPYASQATRTDQG